MRKKNKYLKLLRILLQHLCKIDDIVIFVKLKDDLIISISLIFNFILKCTCLKERMREKKILKGVPINLKTRTKSCP